VRSGSAARAENLAQVRTQLSGLPDDELRAAMLSTFNNTLRELNDVADGTTGSLQKLMRTTSTATWINSRHTGSLRLMSHQRRESRGRRLVSSSSRT
jgi:hypothetical protein